MTRELNMAALTDENGTYIGLLVKSGQKPRYETVLFGKPYLWLEDPDSRRWYLERLYYRES